MRPVHQAVEAFRYVNIVAFVALAAVAFRAWRRRRARAGMWAAAAFGALGLLEVLSLVPNHPGNVGERALGRVEIALLVLFPYLLFRFTLAFRTAARRFAAALFAVTAVLLVWTFALPRLPQAGESWYPAFAAFVALFTVHWTVLATASAVRLWRAGGGQPSVARRRMRLLATASFAIAVALILVVFASRPAGGLSLGAQVLALVSASAFLLGFSPPVPLRQWWRSPEIDRMQHAMTGLLAFAETQEEVADRVLEPAAAMVGARAIAIRNAEGRIVAAWNVPYTALAAVERGGATPELWRDAPVVDVDVPGGSLVVWTSPYAPFFGEDELELLRSLGALTGLALDRVRLYESEHEARLASERANEVMTNFVALAAHELRTPVTTIHGFVTTLHHLGDRLDDEQRESVREALVGQTQRMAQLVEQLLDLSRLDADVIEIHPEPVHVREEIDQIVAAAAPDPDGVQVDVPNDAVAVVDRSALERIVSNLVTNAFRYGAPPVIVRAERTDRHLRLSIEDRGRGVPVEFVPDLFERFTRSPGSRGVAGGTGLGLAIARSYARAHGGDLLYEDAVPHGARFSVVLPAEAQ